MKYKAYITYMVYDSIEVEIDKNESFTKVIDKVSDYIRTTSHQYDDTDVEYEEMEEEDE